MSRKSGQLIEEKRWYRNVRAIVALIAGRIGIVAAVVKFWPEPQPERRDHFEIVPDRSSRMKDLWEQESKWARQQGSRRSPLRGGFQR